MTFVADVIPVFPLNAVLLPGMALPLHIFEPRYRQLLVDVQSESGPATFGIVGLRKGTMLGYPGTGWAEPEIVDVGTLAEILDVTSYADGASDLLTVGSRRFRIRELLTEGTPYLRASVDWLEERDGDLHPAHAAATRRLCIEYFTLLGQLTGRDVDEQLPRDANLLSYHVAAHLPLTLQDRQDLLVEATAADRLRRTIALLRREIRLLQSTRSISVASDVLNLIPHPN
ncbi:MAG: peptidase S16 [Pseudonocardiales bacterium]|nr:MAG: peptidase S16 [Pseudonocardiales bacterium]